MGIFKIAMSLLLLVGALASAHTPFEEASKFFQDAATKHGENFDQWILREIESNNVSRALFEKLSEPAYFELSWGDQIIRTNVSRQTKANVESKTPVEEMPETPVEEKIDPATIWQIGKAIWDLVKDNKAVVDYTTDWSGAVPMNVTDWTTLTEWNTWKSKMYKFEFKNFLGQRLTEFEWTFTCQYGGKYNGKGQYLTLCGASINKIYAYGVYGEEVQVQAKGSAPFNYGTADNPIGGLNLKVSMSSAGHFEKTVVGCQITMKGDSTYTTIQCDQN